MNSCAVFAACALLLANLNVVSANYEYSGCYLYSSDGATPTNTFWAPFLAGDNNLLSCSIHCHNTLRGYFGIFEKQCACQASNSPALTPVSDTMCNDYLGGSGNGNIYVSGFTTPADRKTFSTNEVPTAEHQYHDKGCYRVYNFQYGDDKQHDTIYNPIFGPQETLDNRGQISDVEQCAEICSSMIDGVFGIFQETCFCQEESLVRADVIPVDLSHCDDHSVTTTDKYQGSNGGSHRHEYHYIRLYKFDKAEPITPPPPSPSGSHSCKRGITNCSGPNNQNNKNGPDHPNGPNNKNNKAGPDNKTGKAGPNHKNNPHH